MKHRNDRKALRRTEGEKRLVEWQKLSLEEQLLALTTRPGRCARQIRRLTGFEPR